MPMGSVLADTESGSRISMVEIGRVDAKADFDAALEKPEQFATIQDVLARTRKRGTVRLPALVPQM